MATSISAMDLPAYLQRIGYDGPRVATRAVLADIALQHALCIPFENIDAFLGQRISLDSAAVERKLVGSARGGWCFEQNLLLGEALRALGFDVTDLAARVMWNRPAGVATARTHRLLCVRIEGRQWLVVSRATRQGRHVLRGSELAFHAIDGGTRREVLEDSVALLAVLRDVFGIAAPDAPGLAAKFDAQTGSAARS